MTETDTLNFTELEMVSGGSDYYYNYLMGKAFEVAERYRRTYHADMQEIIDAVKRELNLEYEYQHEFECWLKKDWDYYCKVWDKPPYYGWEN